MRRYAMHCARLIRMQRCNVVRHSVASIILYTLRLHMMADSVVTAISGITVDRVTVAAAMFTAMMAMMVIIVVLMTMKRRRDGCIVR